MGRKSEKETAAAQAALADWNAAIARVIGALESEELPRLLVAALETRVACEAALVIAYRLGRKPLVLYEDLLADEHGVHVDGYLAGAYLLDPFYRASIEGTPSGLHRLSDVAPEGFLESEYYRSYYIRTLQSDEVCFLTDHSDGWVTNISLGRESGAPPFDQRDIDRLRATEPIVHEALRRHWAHRRQRHPESDAASSLHAHVEAALANFGRSALTKREYEVVQLLLRGHSTRSSARELGIAQETIRLHRKNVYAKLDVASQSELFVLFIDSLAHIAEDLSGDPLERYDPES
jgi:DNA-binding CsgD family transcriptional regulator